jgi:hypothetical protein
MKNLILIFVFFATMACEKNVEVTSFSNSTGSINDIIGTWKLTSVHEKGVSSSVCILKDAKQRGIDVKFEKTDSKITFGGRSVINTYGGTYEIINDQLKIKELITTEKADTKEFMECEDRYYRLLSEAKDFKIETIGNTTYLNLGVFQSANSQSTYLRFYKDPQ